MAGHRLSPRGAVPLVLWPALAALNLVDAVFRGGRYAGLLFIAAVFTALVAAWLIRRGPRPPRTIIGRVDILGRTRMGHRA